eukprot:m.121668 g.121668  ORF g.121668 m.121668 type:complete len:668 (-) comp21908_c0_seq1:87-2090(-)
MAAPGEHELFLPLQAAVASGDLPAVVKSAEKILKKIPDDHTALQAKLVSLVKQGSFDDALSFMSRDKSGFFKTRNFERSYCLFRLNRLEEALENLKDGSSHKEHELRAQVLYRLERYDDAIPAYRALMEADGADGTGDSGMEHATNLVAAMVGHEVATRAAGGTATTHTPPPGEGFEQLYNTSCLLLARGRYADALTAIDAALIDCRDVVTSEVGVTDEEVEAELLLLRVQRGAVLHSLGNDVEASKELHQALKHNVEPTLGAIAAANLIAVNKNHNVFDSRKKLPLVAAPEARAKMTAAQRLLVSKNHVLLLMFMGHTEPLKKQLEEFAEEFPQSDLPCLVKASNLMRRKSAALSRECLQNYIDANPTSSDEVRLVMAQIRIEDEDYDSAVKQLQEVQGLRQSPGFTGVLVELLSLQGRHEEATLTLNNAIGFWEKQTSPEAELNLITLLRAGAAYNVVHSKYPEAAALYQKILSIDRQNVVALTELIKCFAEYDLDIAEKWSEQLPPVGTDGPALDVDLLERANTRKRPTAAASGKGGGTEPMSELAAVAAAAASDRPKRRRKKRPGKMPKDYNPNIPADPERWLPKYERSEYKKRHKKKAGLHHALQRGPQGSSKAAADEAAERALAIEKEKASKAAKAEATAAAQIAQQASSKRKKKNNKKKK